MLARQRFVMAMIDRGNEYWLRSLRIPPLSEGTQTSVSLFLYSLFSILLPAQDSGAPDDAELEDPVRERLVQVKKMVSFLEIPGDFDFPPIRALDDPSKSGDYVEGQKCFNMLLTSVRQWLTPSAELVAQLEADLDERERKCEELLSRLEGLASENGASQAKLRRLQDFLKDTPEGSPDRAKVESVLAGLFSSRPWALSRR
jgi:hypothetical protein